MGPTGLFPKFHPIQADKIGGRGGGWFGLAKTQNNPGIAGIHPNVPVGGYPPWDIAGQVPQSWFQALPGQK